MNEDLSKHDPNNVPYWTDPPHVDPKPTPPPTETPLAPTPELTETPLAPKLVADTSGKIKALLVDGENKE